MTLFPTQPNIPSPTTAARPVAVPAPGVSAPLGADDAKRARILADAIRARFAQTLVGQDNLRESLIVTLVAGGHILIESVPGLAKTTAALTKLADAGLPFISILTDPTMGGVSASFAFMGDLVIGEPGALIGFAGPRVIEQTVRETLPAGFQRSEFLLEKGALDLIIDRRELRDRLAELLTLLTRQASVRSVA